MNPDPDPTDPEAPPPSDIAPEPVAPEPPETDFPADPPDRPGMDDPQGSGTDPNDPVPALDWYNIVNARERSDVTIQLKPPGRFPPLRGKWTHYRRV